MTVNPVILVQARGELRGGSLIGGPSCFVARGRTMRKLAVSIVGALLLVGCGGASLTSVSDDAGLGPTCGPGMSGPGHECSVAPDGGGGALPDGDAPLVDAGTPFVPPAALGGASCFAVDPAHDNAVVGAAVASPLEPVWTKQFIGAISFPVVSGTNVIVAASEDFPNIRALDLATGALVWGRVAVGPAPRLAVEGDAVFAIDAMGTLLAFDARTGGALWSSHLEHADVTQAPPVASGGLVYVTGSGEGTATYAIDERTGATVWSSQILGAGSGVAVAGGAVYATGTSDQVSAYDAVSGAVDWLYPGSGTNGYSTAAAAYGGLLWLTYTGGNVVLDANGNVIQDFPAEAIPSFHAGTAFYVTVYSVTAVDIQSHTVKWSFEGDGELCTSAIIAGAGGQVFVGSMSGNIYELDEATGVQRSVGVVGYGVCNSSIGLSAGHLLVPATDTLVVF